MPIPEAQLETWSHQGATTTAKSTHEAIRRGLSGGRLDARTDSYEVYLQGSYKNSTNIRGDSDVDIVVQLNKTFHRDLSGLTDADRARYEDVYGPGEYSWDEFRSDVIADLRRYFTVEEGKKALRVPAGGGRLDADVLACFQYRRYRRFQTTWDQDYAEGVWFRTRHDNREVINFPKLHYDNGVTKNGATRTSGNYKPCVRMFKNARVRLIADGVITSSLAPSYFLECLIYNAPNEHFRQDSFQKRFASIVDWANATDLTKLVCANEQQWLFGPTEEQWNVNDAKRLLSAYVDLWHNW